jgi:hypothetical protein
MWKETYLPHLVYPRKMTKVQESFGGLGENSHYEGGRPGFRPGRLIHGSEEMVNGQDGVPVPDGKEVSVPVNNAPTPPSSRSPSTYWTDNLQRRTR